MCIRVEHLAILLIAVFFALVPAGIALAQNQEPEKVPYCGLLSADDCVLLEASAEAMRMLTSAQSETRTEVYLDGIAGFSADQPVVVRFQQSSFVTEPDVIARLAEFQEMNEETLAAHTNLMQDVEALHMQIDRSNVATFMLSPELSDLIADRFGIELPPEITFEIRLVDGIEYYHVATIAEFVPQLTLLGDWIGIDVNAIISFALARSGDEVGADSIAEVMASELPGEQLPGAVIVEVEDGLRPLYDDFLEMIALRDASAADQPLAVYRTKIDVAELVSSPLLTAQLKAAFSDTEMNLTPVIRIGQVVASSLVSDLDVTIHQDIGMQVPYVYGVDSEISWDLGSTDAADPLARRRVVLLTTARTNGFNNVEAIPAPENAFVPPIGLILGILSNTGP